MADYEHNWPHQNDLEAIIEIAKNAVTDFPVDLDAIENRVKTATSRFDLEQLRDMDLRALIREVRVYRALNGVVEDVLSDFPHGYDEQMACSYCEACGRDYDPTKDEKDNHKDDCALMRSRKALRVLTGLD